MNTKNAKRYEECRELLSTLSYWEGGHEEFQREAENYSNMLDAVRLEMWNEPKKKSLKRIKKLIEDVIQRKNEYDEESEESSEEDESVIDATEFDVEILFDTGGGAVLQKKDGSYVHYYDDPKQLADDISSILSGMSTDDWCGNQPEHFISDDDFHSSGGLQNWSVWDLDEMDDLAVVGGRMESETLSYLRNQ